MLQTIDGLLRKVASERPDAPALVYGDQCLNYGDLLRAIGQAVLALHGQGIGPGVAFAVLCQNCLEVMVAYYAAARMSAVFVPINPSLTAREVAHIIAHSGTVRLFHDDAMREVAEQAAPASLRRPLAALSAAGAPSADAARDPAADFLIIYTSGSTGTPKAVVFDQQAEIAGNASLIEMWGITARDITLVALPLGFLYGLSTAAATGLQAGGQVVIQRRFHPGEVLQAMVAHRVTIYHGVPTMFTMMLDFAEQNDLRIDLSFVRLLICAGAPLSAELKARFEARFGKTIDDYYALTEVRPVFGHFAADRNPIPSGAIGRASPGAIIRIVDGAGVEVADGAHGELVVRAPSTLKRYYKDEALTKAAFLGDLFRTGDLGFRDADGLYHLTGRIKDIIIRGGANIAPAEVEGVIGRHAGVQAAAVIGVPDRKYGEVPVAFVVRRSGAEVTPEALAELCRQELAEFKVPAVFRFVPHFPLGITGKVDKNALKARWTEVQG
jgi:long-chain acyl-CoA synthetase